MKKKSYKGAMIAVGVLLAFFVALEAFLCVWFFGATYPAFEAAARVEAPILGLDEGFTPQGLSRTGETLVVSGYMAKKGEPSRIYFGDKYVTVQEGEKTLTDHFGGVACTQDYCYITSDGRIVRIPLSEALAAENGAAVEVTDSFSTGLQNAFCYIYEDTLFAGEFYRAGNYETEESHRFTEDGETNYALVYAFRMDESKEGGVTSATPEYAISVRGLVQGIAVTEDRIYLSTSYGLADSHVYVYENILSETPTRETADHVPMYRLDDSVLLNRMAMPSMTEGIIAEEGRLYVLFESYSTKYRYFVRHTMDEVVSLPLTAFEE